MSVYVKLLNIQSELKAHKGQYNSFGKYSYRSCEDILEALKPLLKEHKATVFIRDEIIQVDTRYYVKAIVTFVDVETGEKFETSALAREEESKKGQDASQTTGSCSSYARKYALNGLFCIDDTKDADATNDHGKGATTPKQEQQTAANISHAQIKRLYAIGSKANVTAEQIKAVCQREYGVDVLKLTKSQYDAVCDRLEKKSS